MSLKKLVTFFFIRCEDWRREEDFSGGGHCKHTPVLLARTTTATEEMGILK